MPIDLIADFRENKQKEVILMDDNNQTSADPMGTPPAAPADDQNPMVPAEPVATPMGEPTATEEPDAPDQPAM